MIFSLYTNQSHQCHMPKSTTTAPAYTPMPQSHQDLATVYEWYDDATTWLWPCLHKCILCNTGNGGNQMAMMMMMQQQQQAQQQQAQMQQLKQQEEENPIQQEMEALDTR